MGVVHLLRKKISLFYIIYSLFTWHYTHVRLGWVGPRWARSLAQVLNTMGWSGIWSPMLNQYNAVPTFSHFAILALPVVRPKWAKIQCVMGKSQYPKSGVIQMLHGNLCRCQFVNIMVFHTNSHINSKLQLH